MGMEVMDYAAKKKAADQATRAAALKTELRTVVLNRPRGRA